MYPTTGCFLTNSDSFIVKNAYRNVDALYIYIGVDTKDEVTKLGVRVDWRVRLNQ
jgi:predicted NAD/FAD-binding protein